jgi:hypothetical protein
LLVIANWKWITLVFPIWMLLLSLYILLAERGSGFTETTDAGSWQR